MPRGPKMHLIGVVSQQTGFDHVGTPSSGGEFRFSSTRGEAFSEIPHPRTAFSGDLAGFCQRLLRHNVNQENVTHDAERHPHVAWQCAIICRN